MSIGLSRIRDKLRYKKFLGYTYTGSSFWEKRQRRARYKLRTDVDENSRKGMIKKYTYSGIYYHPCCNGGNKQGNHKFNTKVKVIPNKAKIDPIMYHYKAYSENIGIHNFKKDK